MSIFNKNKETHSDNQSKKLLNLLEDFNLYHSDEGETYLELRLENGAQNWPIDSEKVNGYLLNLYYENFKSLPDEKSIKKVVQVLSFKAQKKEKSRFWFRTGLYENKIYLDLSDQHNNFIQIDELGWQVVSTSPIKFYRSASSQPMCTPLSGGNINNLRHFLNLVSDKDFILFLSFMVGALFPNKQFPLLILQGPQGSGKTTATDILKELLDPSVPTLRAFPYNEQDIFIAARNAHLICYDNLSGINNRMSDCLCKISTGCGISGRKLYTNKEEYFIELTRPVVINGIDDLTTRADLVDRSLVINLEKLPSIERKSSIEMKEKFQEMKPYFLGQVCDGLVSALKNKNKIELNEKPRMVDFCIIACAGLQKFNYEVDDVLQAFLNNKKEIALETIESNPVGRIIKSFMQDNKRWEGTVTELFTSLIRFQNSEFMGVDLKSPNYISRELKRISQALESEGILLEKGRVSERRYIVLKKVDLPLS